MKQSFTIAVRTYVELLHLFDQQRPQSYCMWLQRAPDYSTNPDIIGLHCKSGSQIYIHIYCNILLSYIGTTDMAFIITFIPASSK